MNIKPITLEDVTNKILREGFETAIRYYLTHDILTFRQAQQIPESEREFVYRHLANLHQILNLISVVRGYKYPFPFMTYEDFYGIPHSKLYSS